MSKDNTKHIDSFRHVSLSDIYLHYPYKWWDINGKTIPRKPYVPKKDVSNHKYKLSWKAWKLIIEIYLDTLLDYLMEGNLFKMPLNMGMLKVAKYKYDYPNKSNSLYKWCRKYADGYFFKIVWIVKGNYNITLKNKMWFKFRLTPYRYRKLQKRIEKDRSLIYRFPTYKGYNRQ